MNEVLFKLTDTLNCATCQLVGFELRIWAMEGEISEYLQIIR